MKRVELIEFDENWDPKEVTHHEWAEDAEQFAAARHGQNLVWNDTQIGMEGTDEVTQKAITEGGYFGDPLPGHPIFQYTGFDEATGEAREIESTDWKDA